jgi:hypothetical protein
MSKASKSPESQRDAKAITGQLQELMAMTVSELRAKYLDVFSLACHSRNKDYLRKKIAFRIQELAEGGLSDKAKAKIEELAASVPLRQRRSRRQSAAVAAPKAAAQPSVLSGPTTQRDQRLPPPGTMILREYGGSTHEVKVLLDGFEYLGRRYASLSKVASDITGAHWNGFAFFAAALSARVAQAPAGRTVKVAEGGRP